MNKEHLNQIISNYIARFKELNDSKHAEYYKWQIAYRFKNMMDDALNAAPEVFAKKLREVRNATYNFIDSSTQPFAGLVYFAEQSEEKAKEVQDLFKELFMVKDASVSEKQAAIQQFLEGSHRLRDELKPGSYHYNDDMHSVCGYLFLYDPEHNYMYQATRCRPFADCIEFYDDWGSGESTKLSVFYRMCNEVVPLLKENEALINTDVGRRAIDPSGMHPDPEKHILLFDLIYCCTSYGLFDGISFVIPKTAERKLIEERREKANKYKGVLDKANERQNQYDEALDWLNRRIVPGAAVHHKANGKGVIKACESGRMTVSFSGIGEKVLGVQQCLATGLVWLDDKEAQKEILKYRDVLNKGQEISDEVKRAEKDLLPYTEYLD